jgi:hypothetical protein
MARLQVEACSAEWTSGDVSYTLLVGISVSHAKDGKAVTGLKEKNFRVASDVGLVKDFKVGTVYEWKWEPSDTEAAGCYQLEINLTPVEKFVKGKRYIFGIQARTFAEDQKPQVIDQGQTIVQLISAGD